eukprot:TRINITY_DN4819_c1_g1_i3.p1 TRINITY_DN4819_c1_g1~~TRINITY_DN4819_c1_g1_i3.p1  ORF type:complete len:398 (-),score=59.53 TRINITY_DN4819_c1_g1_i3:18-1211(-)
MYFFHRSDIRRGRGAVGHEKRTIDSKLKDLSEQDLGYIEEFWRKIAEGGFRWFPYHSSHFLSRLDTDHDDLIGRLSNICSSLNIYAGLIASGLVGYVMDPATVTDETIRCEITGFRKRTLSEMQMLTSHVNLVISLTIFASSTFTLIFLNLESVRTIKHAACKAENMFMWWGLLQFFQLICFFGQVVLAALINMSNEAAKVALAVDISVATLFVSWTLWQLNQTFLVTGQQFVLYAPNLLLKQLLFGRDRTIRHSQRWAEEATEFLEHLLTENPKVKVAEDDSLRHKGSRALLMQSPKEEVDKADHCESASASELLLLLKKAFPHAEDVRLREIATAMLDESLTVETLKDCFQLPVASQVLQVVVNLLDIPAASLTQGERLRIATVAFKQFSNASPS